MSIISSSMAGKILKRLTRDNEKVRCFENLNIDKDRWQLILFQISEKYKIFYVFETNKNASGWKWSFEKDMLNIETDVNPITAASFHITKINFVMGKKEIVDDFETLIKEGTIISENN